MSDGLRYYYERFKELPDTARLLTIVTALGLCSLYVLGLVSLIAGPRLRQAPVAYAEAVIYVTSTPTHTPVPEPTETPVPEPTWPPTAIPTAVPPVALVAAPGVPTVEPTPTQRSYQPIPTPTEPRVEPRATPTRTATRTGRAATSTPKNAARGKATATPTRTVTPKAGARR